MNNNENSKVLLSIQHIKKSFPGVMALDDISVDIHEHEILGLAGENGAGKSTLMKIIAGVKQQSSGEMYLNGKLYLPGNYRKANKHGISMVFQEQNLVPNIAGYENIFLSHEDSFMKRFGILNKKEMIEKTRGYFEQFDLDIDPAQLLHSYSFHQRQVLEIARAFIISELYGVESPLILLDEPTAVLSEIERKLLFDKIIEYSDRATFILISHRLSELMNRCERIVVFKDGRNAGEVKVEDATEKDLHMLMVGRELSADTYRVSEQDDTANKNPIVEVERLAGGDAYHDISFSVNKGEILGIGGLVGCGKAELGKAVFGIDNFEHGEIRKSGKRIDRVSIFHMIKNKFGYVPSERKVFGIIEYLSVGDNISLPSILSLKKKYIPIVDTASEQELITKSIRKFRIKAEKAQMCFSLSGGNQQKVVLAKWIAKDLDVLILHNPTRGIDVGAKEEIYALIREIAKEGLSVLLITDDLLELIGLSNRIIIMKEGTITNERIANKDDKPTESELIKYMV